jgi:hypothetical protein
MGCQAPGQLPHLVVVNTQENGVETPELFKLHPGGPSGRAAPDGIQHAAYAFAAARPEANARTASGEAEGEGAADRTATDDAHGQPLERRTAGVRKRRVH